MDLTTTYLGLKLRTPLVPSASPLSEEIRRHQTHGRRRASAVVLYSLFEEQLRPGPPGTEPLHGKRHVQLCGGADLFSGAGGISPRPEDYLKHIANAKKSVKIPIIASLNGSSPGGWTQYAKLVQQAGADALELNIYYIPTNHDLPREEVGSRPI